MQALQRTRTAWLYVAMIVFAVVGAFLIVPQARAASSPASLIEDVPASRSVYNLRDSAGHRMEAAKIVSDPTTAGRYLAVYHWVNAGTYNVGVATSYFLRNWTYRRTLDTLGSQPDLAFSPRNGPILAVQGKPNNSLRFRYWNTIAGMIGTAAPYRTFDAPKTLSSCAEGTPSINTVTYAGSTSTITSGSVITVSHHYSAACASDREAAGTLTDFGTWKTAALTTVDNQLTAAGALGKHGDRDTFSYQSKQYTLFEGSVSGSSFTMGDWRNYLTDGTTTTQLAIHTAQGSISTANPSASILLDPAGVPSLLVTQFIPPEGAGTGESGELLYWQPLGSTPTSTPTATATPTETPTPTPSPSPSAGKVTKVLTFVEENHSLSQMQSGMPYLYTQAKKYGYATNYRAITHPSLPNYLAMVGGSTFGVTDDNSPSSHPQTGGQVFGAALATGHTAKAYQESMPSNCYLSGSGNYAVKHNPWAYWTDDRTNCQRFDVPSGSLSSGQLRTDIVNGTLPDVGYVTPNLCNDAHNCSLGTADNWLKGWLELIYASPDFKSGHLAVILTADEDDMTSVNLVLTTVIHPSQQAHVVSTALTHYSWTRLMTDLTGAPCIRGGCTATNMASAFALPMG